ncbi:MAG TPA: TetR/AcrR family transcriptional regulator [Gemmatimonadales bacterium]
MRTLPYDARLEHLLASAAKVFAAKGYHATTMRDLARASGMSLAGMYYYVRGMDELLYLIQDRCFTQVLGEAQAALDALDDPAERLREFIHHHITFFSQHRAEMKVLSHEAQSLSRARLTGITALKRRYVNLLLGLIEQAEPEAELPQRTAAAYALFGMMNWIYTWYDPAGPIAPPALAEQFAQIFLQGLLHAEPATAPHGG